MTTFNKFLRDGSPDHHSSRLPAVFFRIFSSLNERSYRETPKSKILDFSDVVSTIYLDLFWLNFQSSRKLTSFRAPEPWKLKRSFKKIFLYTYMKTQKFKNFPLSSLRSKQFKTHEKIDFTMFNLVIWI